MSEKRNVPKLRFPGFEAVWPEKKFGKFVLDSAFGPRFSSDLYDENGNVATLRTTDLDLEGNVSYSTMPHASVDMESFKDHILQEGDVVVSRSGTIGITAVFESFSKPVLPGAFLIRFRLNPGLVHSKFVRLLFNSKQGRDKLNSLAAGGVQKNLTGTSVKEAEFFFPSFPEQQKIAEFLTAVDRRIELLQAKKEKLEAYKKGLMQKIFSQKLRFKADDGSDFPDWEERKLGEVYEFRTTNSFSRDKLNYETGEYRNIHYGDIHTKFPALLDLEKVDLPFVNEDVEIRKSFSENLVEDGDLLIADASEDYAYIGKTIEVVNSNGQKVLAGLHTLHAKRKQNNTELGFGGYIMKSDGLRAQIMKIAQGTKVLSISVPRMRELDLALPSLGEQKKIVQFLTNLDRSIENLNQQITHTQTWKKGLLQKMFV